jgi:hypothetical protein
MQELAQASTLNALEALPRLRALLPAEVPGLVII